MSKIPICRKMLSKRQDARESLSTRSAAVRPHRPGLDKLSELLRQGDTLVVWRLDRLGRSLKDLIEWVNRLEQWGVGLRSLQESIDCEGNCPVKRYNRTPSGCCRSPQPMQTGHD